jgi:uncharacterized protein
VKRTIAMNPPQTSLPRIAALCLMGVLAACNVVPPPQDDATRYFILSDPAAPAPPGGLVHGTMRIGLKSVVLDGYLRRREMVVRTGENEVAFKDYKRWAEPLDTAVSRIVRSTLAASPAVAEVYTEPFPFGPKRDYDVSIEIRRCEGAVVSGKYVARLSAIIQVSTTGDDAHVVSRRLVMAPPESWDGDDYGQLANLLSIEAAGLGRDVLADIPEAN